jgi:solute:Na+ symporter, SSS family
MLTAIDWIIIVLWLALTFGVGLWYSRRASRSTDEYFVTDRSLPWWVVGTSMVATTFAADTPLAVSGYVARNGIADNWKWWFVGMSGITSAFLFARLWRRAEIITDAELVEFRYGGQASRVLRAAKALFFGVLLNLLTIAWVMSAMRKIVLVVLDIKADATFAGFPADAVVVMGLFVLAVVYTSTAGLWGVIATDLLQFLLAMFGSIVLAVLCWRAAGGREGLQAGFSEYRFDWERTTTLLPLDDPTPDGATAKFIVLMGVMWWATKNIDGNGYLAQRLFAAKDDRHAMLGFLWFTVANLCLRPWPWIVVGLAGMAMLGPLADPELYYPMMMVKVLPAGLFGLMVASFLAAFMSTIDTQLNWGASLLINDVYRRFLAPDAEDAHHLFVSRLAVLGLALLGAIASLYLDSIAGAWEFAFAITAGLGTVYIARWYWWRVSAWSEWAAMGSGLAAHLFLYQIKQGHSLFLPGPWLDAIPTGWLAFPFNAVFTTAVCVPVWVGVTLLTAPCEREHLRTFYRRVRPGGRGWAAVASDIEGFEHDGLPRNTWLGIIGGGLAIYGFLLGTGELLVGTSGAATAYYIVAAAGTWLMLRGLNEPARPNASEPAT